MDGKEYMKQSSQLGNVDRYVRTFVHSLGEYPYFIVVMLRLARKLPF